MENIFALPGLGRRDMVLAPEQSRLPGVSGVMWFSATAVDGGDLVTDLLQGAAFLDPGSAISAERV